MHDAIVVGAGLSGLACASRLLDAGRDVIVLEARDRVGGRLVNGSVGGAIVDLGGQWMSTGQPLVAALASDLGVATFAQRRDGQIAIDDGGARGWWARLAVAIAQWRAVRRIDRMVRDAPSIERDAITLGEWLDGAVPNRVARDRIAMQAELVFAADPADLSFAYYLANLAATGGFSSPGVEHRFAGGAQSLALGLASRLGDRIRLDSAVTVIADDGDAVSVRTTGDTHAARRVVLAVPPGLARQIDVALAPDAARFAAAVHAGPVVKCFVAYDRAFWRDDGWSGEAYWPRGLVRATVDASPPDGPPIVLAFVVGNAAVGWAARDRDDRRAAIVAILMARFGDRAASPIDYADIDWGADRWSDGCVAGVGPGVVSSGATWRAPHGRIHLAGTETARTWPGYMEGAIEAGLRAAEEILDGPP